MKRQCRYIEEFPARLLPRLEEITGWSSNDLFVLNMQYGSNYSGPGRVGINGVLRIPRVQI